jgi:hypothetical protein
MSALLENDLYLDQIDSETVIDNDMTEIIESLEVRQTATGARLSVRQLKALEVLMTRRPNETLALVAGRAGLSRATIHRYLVDPDFISEYKARCEADLTSLRHNANRALARGMTREGTNQIQYLKLYYQRYGELSADVINTVNNTVNLNANVNTFNSALPIDLEHIPVEYKRKMVALLDEIAEYAANSDKQRLLNARNVTPSTVTSGTPGERPITLDSLLDGPAAAGADTQDGADAGRHLQVGQEPGASTGGTVPMPLYFSEDCEWIEPDK